MFQFYSLSFLALLVLGQFAYAQDPYLNGGELKRIQDNQTGWEAHIHPDFEKHTIADFQKLISTLPPTEEPDQMSEIPQDEVLDDAERLLQSIPTSFDARSKWPSCIGPIRTQGSYCGACWAFATAMTFEDRLCTFGKVYPLQQRSMQWLIDCDRNESGCTGGNTYRATQFLVTYGTPTEACYPYVGYQKACSMACSNRSTVSTPKARSAVTYANINSVKYDLMTYGPVTTWYSVYQDFFYYKSGIYWQTSNVFIGYHAVKIVGWGYDSSYGYYWTVANSWGATWGENGYFRILAGQCGIDTVSHISSMYF